MSANEAPPNLLYIHSDQHTPSVLGCYGDPVVSTPNLDALARDGAVLENTYCPSPICVPSRMSTLTGRHPYQNQVWTNRDILGSGVPTLAHAMGAGGYTPILSGRMHSLGPDQLRGYARRMVGDHSSNYWGGETPDRGVLEGTSGPRHVSLSKSGPGQSAYEVHDEYVAECAVGELNRIGIRRRAGIASEPFSLTVGFMLPHAPFVARREDFMRYEGRVPSPRTKGPASDAADHPFLAWWRRETGAVSVSEEEAMRARTAYWALVERLDSLIGRILRALRDNGLADNTIILYSSDHGEHLGEHGLWWKHTFYEESVRVPAILSWPGTIPSGLRFGGVVSSLDLGATLLDAMGAPSLPASNGRSLLPFVVGDAGAWENIAFSEYCTDEYGPPGGVRQRMIRRDEWKLIYHHDAPLQLFNLREDPTECHDRATDPGCAGVREDLLALVLDDWDPEEVRRQMLLNKSRAELIAPWARSTRPAESHRWQMTGAMNRLDLDGRPS